MARALSVFCPKSDVGIDGAKYYVIITRIFVNNQLDAKFFSCMFISVLYMFRAAMCTSSGELVVST
jgi:hypothetical protein